MLAHPSSLSREDLAAAASMDHKNYLLHDSGTQDVVVHTYLSYLYSVHFHNDHVRKHP